jgi:aspartyl-tRNA(Asn)/glutamyl-tRNA(Gln) amidotransferase subunit A
MTDLTRLTIAEARTKLSAKEISAVELTEAYIVRDRRTPMAC